MVDKTPVPENENEEEEIFGGFDDEGDEVYIERARRSRLRRKGVDPKAKKVNGTTPTIASRNGGGDGEVDGVAEIKATKEHRGHANGEMGDILKSTKETVEGKEKAVKSAAVKIKAATTRVK